MSSDGPVPVWAPRARDRPSSADRAAWSFEGSVEPYKGQPAHSYEQQVERTTLLSWFRELPDSTVVLVTAPAGYGKTTVLQQWADSQSRPVARLTLDAADNDAVVLLGYVAATLGALEPLEPGLFAGPLSDPSFFEHVLLPRFGQVLQNRRNPFLLLIDDVHTVTSRRSWRALSTIISSLPETSLLVLCGRSEPPPILVRSADGSPLPRVERTDLAFDRAEGSALLRSMGLDLSAGDEDALMDRTEGWPAALYLAGLSLQDHPDTATALARFSGSGGLIADYLREEFLAGTSSVDARFLMRTAVLGDVTGPLCDAVLDGSGSEEALATISRGNLLLRATNPQRGWYRYHQLLADLLRTELHRREPELEPVLHARASTWLESNGFTSAAISHAQAAGDPARAAELVWAQTPNLITSGRRGTVERWMEEFSSPQLVADPLLALAEACCALSSGEPTEPWLLTAQLALRTADRPVHSGVRPHAAVALLHAIPARDGSQRMLIDAEQAYGLDSSDSPGRIAACYLAGAAHRLRGEVDQAKAWLQEGRQLAMDEQVGSLWAMCAGQLGLIAALDGDWVASLPLVEEAMDAVHAFELEDYATMAPVLAVQALVRAHGHFHVEARSAAARAEDLLSSIAHVAPWLAVEVRAVLARAHLFLGNSSAATALLEQADEQLQEMSDATALVTQLDTVRGLTRASAGDGRRPGPTLTAAEERVMRLLSTHLSFEGIAERLFISKNTVKTQAISVYRKLGVHSRSAAVRKSRSVTFGSSD